MQHKREWSSFYLGFRQGILVEKLQFDSDSVLKGFNMSRYVIGDIHGCYDRMIGALNNVNFNLDKDILYGVGDFCDRGEDNLKCLNYLIGLGDSFRSVFGNHDIWLLQYLDVYKDNILGTYNRYVEECWMYNGGRTTIREMSKLKDKDMSKIFDFYDKLPYRIELSDFIIQHTTIRPVENIVNSPDESLIPKDIDLTSLSIRDVLTKGYCDPEYDSWFWDRSVLEYAMEPTEEKCRILYTRDKVPYISTSKPLIIGHTPLVKKGINPKPFYSKAFNLIAMDTGSFVTKKMYECEGCITVVNLDTMEWTTSDNRKGKFDIA